MVIGCEIDPICYKPIGPKFVPITIAKIVLQALMRRNNWLHFFHWPVNDPLMLNLYWISLRLVRQWIKSELKNLERRRQKRSRLKPREWWLIVCYMKMDANQKTLSSIQIDCIVRMKLLPLQMCSRTKYQITEFRPFGYNRWHFLSDVFPKNQRKQTFWRKNFAVGIVKTMLNSIRMKVRTENVLSRRR